MRLIRTHIENFKLLEDVRLEFSSDPAKPLTVIRAENGSGKTSLLYALLWAFYGMPGLPEAARSLRLTSSAIPPGTQKDISVMVEFDHRDENDYVTRYRLIRSVVETPSTEDKVERTNERVRLLRITGAGEEDVKSAEAVISKLVPLRLKDVFFTNGDAVQTFISGSVSSQQRQHRVHESIKALLGLEALRTAVADIEASYKRLRADAAKAGGADTSKLEQELETTDEEIETHRTQQESINDQLANMTEQKTAWEKDLNSLRGIGNLDQLNSDLERAKAEHGHFEAARARALTRMRDSLKSEACSWMFMSQPLDEGLKVLSDLADRRVIPGASIEVLTDRLELELCICGEPLAPGSSHREHVERLRDEQQQTSERKQRLTQLRHTARYSQASEMGRQESDATFSHLRTSLLKEFIDARDQLATKAREIEHLTEKRSLIDETRVQALTENLKKVEAQIKKAEEELTRSTVRMEQLEERRQSQKDRLDQAEKAARSGGTLALKRDVAHDLHFLAQGTLDVLQGDYVERVSARMSDIFMSIVGSHPDFEAGVFTGVHIDDRFNIVVDTHDGRQLDTDFELNGASQRALTLAFVWSLMEISGVTAPRIIDAPLGMVSGGVKTRMLDAITQPQSEESQFQVALLLTRSEIRDAENLLDERSGVVRTLSCSKDYPEDLLYSWGVDRPMSRVCTCDHRQSCRVCARHYDENHGIAFRDKEASA